ncbi:hypothetical protein L332_02405 [Agrococcus pavilionensis RW1]|uniref:DUF3375 domain-containing protein n=1 Tax=Agrococcus pavilionensis RW1 TaxID=1330458 RepID=U1MRN1_9MICO|nr:DUF3375 domain-containing protein [Agrococcus pavilionensis]ERG63305.1 hypothetical protein L332_02405 [Agrococcus pavilionensis RW1]
MTTVSAALRLQRLVADDPALALLRAEHAPIIVALLSRLLGGEVRRRPAEEFVDLVDADLDALRPHFELPQTGKAYAAAWRAAGWLVRRPAAEARAETVELSPAALRAIRVFEQLEQPRATATESRLMTIRDQVQRLAIETDPDGARRREALERERAAIDAQIRAIGEGRFEPLDAARTKERVAEILRLAEDVPSDFQRVRFRFDELNHELMASLLDADESQRTVLEDIFRGVDLIEQTDEGLTFAAFSVLVLDAERSEAFEADIASLLERDLGDAMSMSERRFLRTFLRELKLHSHEIHGVLAEFARGLRRYVQSQDFQRDRALQRSIRAALATALRAAEHVKPFHASGVELPLTSVELSSIGALTAHDPSEFAIDEHVVAHEPGLADYEQLKALARDTEIDFEELTGVVNARLRGAEALTVAQLLADWPATQGVASVVGLMTLAMQHGSVSGDETETLVWPGVDGTTRSAVVRSHRFVERIPT